MCACVLGLKPTPSTSAARERAHICSHTRNHVTLAAWKLVAFRSDNVLKRCLLHTPSFHFPLHLLRPAPESFAALVGPSLDRFRLKTPTEGIAEKFPPKSCCGRLVKVPISNLFSRLHETPKKTVLSTSHCANRCTNRFLPRWENPS